MMASKDTSPELRMSMLLDRERDYGEHQEFEAALRDDPQARALYERLRSGSDRGRAIFDDLLKEPVPLDLVRTIKTAPPPRRAVRLPSPSRPAFDFKLPGMQTAIASLVLVALAGSLGYTLGRQPSVPAQTVVTQADRDWLDDIVAHYRIFSRQTDRLAEMPASDPAAVVEWLLTNTGVNFRIPDLTDNDLTFQGARLFAAGGMPIGELLYTSDEGEVIAILFRKNQPDDDGFSELIRDNIALMSWRSATATYVAIGPSSAASLGEIAAKAAGLI
ncbi:MAG: anti-sigma factor family protein [Pseudorhizobium sp.]